MARGLVGEATEAECFRDRVRDSRTGLRRARSIDRRIARAWAWPRQHGLWGRRPGRPNDVRVLQLVGFAVAQCGVAIRFRDPHGAGGIADGIGLLSSLGIGPGGHYPQVREGIAEGSSMTATVSGWSQRKGNAYDEAA